MYQGSAVSPYLFVLVMDALLQGTVREAPWDMLFADDMAVVGETIVEVQEELRKITDRIEGSGLRENRVHGVQLGRGDAENVLQIQDSSVKRVGEFKYLGQ